MPYQSNSELPPPVKKLPTHAQDIFRSAFNAANTEYKDEKKAFATAWAAVEHAGYGAPGSDVSKAVWSGAMMDNLPDSAFLYIEGGGSKDDEGKTTPRSLRHFPVRDASGKVDLAHVRNALARIPQSNVSSSAKAHAQAEAQRLLDHAEGESKVDSEAKGDKGDVKKECRLIKSADQAKQILYCVVTEPDSEDLQGDVMTTDEIEKMAHAYLLDSRVVGDAHTKNKSGNVIQADAGIVESFIAPVDFQVGVENIRKGSWVIAIKVNDPSLWAEVEKGDITGVSIGGIGERVEA